MLSPVAVGVIWFQVGFNNQSVGLRGNGGARHGWHEFAAPGGMAGIDNYRQVRHCVQHRNGGDIQRVSCRGLKGADAALAQDHLVVTAGHDVFGRKQQLFKCSRDTPLQEHRLTDLA